MQMRYCELEICNRPRFLLMKYSTLGQLYCENIHCIKVYSCEKLVIVFLFFVLAKLLLLYGCLLQCILELNMHVTFIFLSLVLLIATGEHEFLSFCIPSSQTLSINFGLVLMTSVQIHIYLKRIFTIVSMQTLSAARQKVYLQD